MHFLAELAMFLLELVLTLLFEGLARLPNRYGGYGCAIVAAGLALLVGSIVAWFVLSADLWQAASQATFHSEVQILKAHSNEALGLCVEIQPSMTLRT